MKATKFISTLTYTLEELLALTSGDDTGSELEQKLSANGDSRWVQHGAYGLVESCKKVVDELLVFERGEQTQSDWQRQQLIPGWEQALGLYETKISMIDSYYRGKLIV